METVAIDTSAALAISFMVGIYIHPLFIYFAISILYFQLSLPIRYDIIGKQALSVIKGGAVFKTEQAEGANKHGL